MPTAAVRHLLTIPHSQSQSGAAAQIHTGAHWEQARVSRSWNYATCAGRLVELSGTQGAPLLTLTLGLVVDAQRAGEPVAWVQGTDTTFFPPDAVRNGVDLNALIVVRLAEPKALGKAATRLLRSGAFGLVVIDLTNPGNARIAEDSRARTEGNTLQEQEKAHSIAIPRGTSLSPALLGKLGQLAQQHGTAVCCLTAKRPERPSMGSLISLRGEALRQHTGEDAFTCTVRVLKDKRGGAGWQQEEVAHGAPGLP